ncbi:MAG TPA: peptidylprolyl isomerase [Burkholderiaceae bacterium]|nr:peptidylprolyl isomerase [Burkholderiaceae bacterium]HRA78191.1 peptidylprolyl isomerase [Burkholderiaceae bacterium]
MHRNPFLRLAAAASSSLALLASIVGLLAAAPAAAQSAVPVDRVVAVVNSEAITARELALRLRVAERQLRAQNIEAPPADLLEKQVLERMIVDRAQSQAARELGIRADEAQVDRALAAIAQENQLTIVQLRERVERDGTSFARFRDDIREEIVRQRLREREIDSRIQVSDADIDAFLASQPKGAQPAAELHVAQILLAVPEGATAEQIERQRLRGEEVVRQLQRGNDFARLAAAFSDAPEAMSGGSLGWRTPQRLPQLFLDALSNVGPGQVSGLVRSPAGFHVLKLIDRRSTGSVPGAGSAPVTQTRARHILIRPNEIVSEDEALRRLREIRQRVQGGSGSFEDLARQYSVDGSAGRGGDLGWVYPGDTVPEFERAMNALAPGQISDPVRTPFGVHLIQVLERRTDEASPDRLRQMARQALRERRIEENYQDWLRQLRDRTYVEYKLEG